ncbi:LytR/AlgR family response regulator transcription factor [Streptococcus merionis]|uniref:Response regulator n=1 Tax=Streptococcus merionis TaxID=400065 RepID=A0A239T1Y0_9STRE|nr:LytTR family DNA-binding domain-containing protein [Streptococcus merionis]SNU91108.1 response regulator [Streptococcus merionis]
MYRIAICDDDISQVGFLESQILSYFEEIGIPNEIDGYHRGEKLIKSIVNQRINYQLIFLDIEMNGFNGIETAKILRKIDKNFLLIYVTSYEQYALESFEVFPFRYLIKPVSAKELRKVLKHSLIELSGKQEYLFYQIGSSHFQVQTSEIILLSSELGRKIHIELQNGDSVSFYGKITSIEKQLSSTNFVKVNSGTIVNMHYIVLFTPDSIQLKNGSYVTISRSRKKIVKSLYNQFIERNFGI